MGFWWEWIGSEDCVRRVAFIVLSALLGAFRGAATGPGMDSLLHYRTLDP